MPRNVVAVGETSSISVTWSPPATGSPVTGYTVTVTASPDPSGLPAELHRRADALLRSDRAGEVTTDVAGDFRAPTTLPWNLVAGEHTIVAPDGSRRAIALAITAGTGSKLPVTGAPIALLLMISAAFAAIGAGLLVAGNLRSRRHAY